VTVERPHHTRRIEIRWRDMDAFEHVNNAVYATYLEECRDQAFERMLGTGATNEFVLARVALDFRSSATQDDRAIDVSLRLARVGRSSIATNEQIHAASDGRLLVDAEAVLVRIDRATGRSRPLDDGMTTRLHALLA
jgi:acyl-CoA thioester hydrolase